MARKRAPLTLRKRRRSSKSEAKEVDTNIYEVERFLESSIENNTIFYKCKWVGYSQKTKEPEYRLNCDAAFVAFAKTKIDPKGYVESIPDSIEALNELQEKKDYILDHVDPLTSIAQSTIHGGNVKFVNFNTVSSKWKFLNYIVSNKQSYVLHSALVPLESEIQESLEQYQEELDQLQKLFPDYPKIKIVEPRQNEEMFYSPPPLSNILFEPVTEEMFDKRQPENCHFFPASGATGFNKVKPFVEPFYFRTFDRKKYEETCDSKRTHFQANPRFKVSMQLTQVPVHGWYLQLAEEVEGNTPLMLMTGVLRPSSVALKSLEDDGERVSFSSFIEVPGTGMCLDRRELHDYSKYIEHSCEPTCAVRLVNSGSGIPDLVVYSLHPIDESYSFRVTLDYYHMFRKDSDRYFAKNPAPDGKIFSLYERGIDFVQCLCDTANCSGVLYVSAKDEIDSEPPGKVSNSSDYAEPAKFGGLNLAESNIVYTIKEGKFVK